MLNRWLPSSDATVVVRSGHAAGVRLVIQPRTEKYYWTGAYEVPLQEVLARELTPGSIFWDVGAHAGFFTLLGSRLVGDAGRVHAFEPMPDNRSRLERAIELNGARNVTVHAYALAGHSGDAVLYDRGASTMWTLAGGDGDAAGPPIACRTLDELDGVLDLPDVLKIDVEGLEVEVLRGGMSFLERHRPAVLVEIMSDDAAAETRALLPFYRFERLGPFHLLLS